METPKQATGQQSKNVKHPPAGLVLAGGYDERLPENVEHAAELEVALLGQSGAFHETAELFGGLVVIQEALGKDRR